jgi:hypothetical protein
MKIKVTRQEELAVFSELNYTGKFFAVTCAKGLMAALGRKVRPGETILLELTLTELKEGESNGSN